MRDLNHLYSEFLIENTRRERLEEAKMRSRVAQATAGRSPAWRRWIVAARVRRQVRPALVTDPTMLPETERGVAS